jgi:hypothetical protein
VSFRSAAALVIVMLGMTLAAMPARAEVCAPEDVFELKPGCYRIQRHQVPWGAAEVIWLQDAETTSIIQVISGTGAVCQATVSVPCPNNQVKVLTGDENFRDLTAMIADVQADQDDRIRQMAREQQSLQVQQKYLDRMMRQLAMWRTPGTPAVSAGTDLGYVPISLIVPGQVRYASPDVTERVARARKVGDAVAQKDGPDTLRFDGGHSMLPPEEPLGVIAGPTGYVLIDGHVDVLASLEIGATTIPLKVVADLTSFAEGEFWRQAEQRGYIYPHATGGRPRGLPRYFGDMIDDPNLYLVETTARTCTSVDGSTVGAEFPLWIKVSTADRFVEQRIADALYSKGFRYRYPTGGGAPPDSVLESARGLLLLNPLIKGMSLVREKMRYNVIPALCSADSQPPP